MEIRKFVTPDFSEASLSIYGHEVPIIKDMLRPYASDRYPRQEINNVLRVAARHIINGANDTDLENQIRENIEIRFTTEDLYVFIQQMKRVSADYLSDFEPLGGIIGASYPGILDLENTEESKPLSLEEQYDLESDLISLYVERVDNIKRITADFADPSEIMVR